VSADLEALLTCLYVLVDDLLPVRRRFGRPPRISDSELICRAVAQVLLDCPNERRSCAWRSSASGTCSPTSPASPGSTSGCDRWRRDCLRRSSCSPSCHPRSATGSGCSTRRQSPAPPPARPSAAHSWPATAATATAAGSGASGSTSSADPRGCRSASSSRPPTSPSGSSPPSCSSVSSSRARR
jgi:hypothetical protein